MISYTETTDSSLPHYSFKELGHFYIEKLFFTIVTWTSDSYITTSLCFGKGRKQLLLWPDSVQVSFWASMPWKSIQGHENFPNPRLFCTVGHLYGARQNNVACMPEWFFQIVNCVSFESEVSVLVNMSL